MLVKDGGVLLIIVPNFLGYIQKKLHQLFDRDNLERHHLPAMDASNVLSAVGSEFSILYSGYFGGFDFWVDSQKRNVIQNKCIDLVLFANKHIQVNANNKLWSPYYGMVALKNK